MRKLTPEERLAKQAAQHIHTEDCGHTVEVVAEPVVEVTPEPVAEEAPVAEEVVAEPVVEEAVAEVTAEEAPVAEEVSAESKPKKKSTPKY